jgi:hypothetical protein
VGAENVNAFASVMVTSRVVVNLMLTSVVPAAVTTGDCSSNEPPVENAWTIPLSPNHTYTGTEVGNCPVIDSQVPPDVDACRGDMPSTRQVPSLTPGGAGVVVGGDVDAGGWTEVPGGATVEGTVGVPGVVVPGTVVTVGGAIG